MALLPGQEVQDCGGTGGRRASGRSGPAGPAASPFERLADRYDRWFESPKGRRVFRVEAACIRDLLIGVPRPWLEVGVGTGRFAAALDVDEGVDPSAPVLRYAARRGIRTRQGSAEDLPYADRSFGAVLLIVTVCFLSRPAAALSECRRILRPDGRLIVGLVPKDSPWGRAYARRGREGHPFYSNALFYTCREVIRAAEKAGFFPEDSRSCLFEDPAADVARYRQPAETLVPGAGFAGLRFGLESGTGSRF